MLQIVDRCVEVISKNFSAFCSDDDWNFLPVDAFMKMLNNDYLAVKDEYKLYQMVTRVCVKPKCT